MRENVCVCMCVCRVVSCRVVSCRVVSVKVKEPLACETELATPKEIHLAVTLKKHVLCVDVCEPYRAALMLALCSNSHFAALIQRAVWM